MRTYEKIYTRDNGLIIQEAWSYAFKEFQGERNPYDPVNVYYVLDGATEIWHGVEAHEWFKKRVLEQNKKSVDMFQKISRQYASLLEELKKWKREGKASSLPDFRKFIDLVFTGSRCWVFLYYSATIEETPAEIRKEALRFRNDDRFYDDCERFIKDTITNLFPLAEGRELVITLADSTNIPDRKILAERMKHFVFIPGVSAEIIDFPTFRNQHPDYHFLLPKINQEAKRGIIKGNSAYPGIVQGVVRILRRKNQVSECKEGEILISPMTTPDFIPAMRKAAAIVTDEGGITCHAAIVARELKKPCVVGTKIATQILKDGDFVEVDANQGMVRKIK